MDQDRRRFVKTTSSLLIASPVAFYYNPGGKFSLSDDIQIGLIGANGMGWSNISSLLKIKGTRLHTICDIDQNVSDRRRTEFKGNFGYDVALCSDYRELLASAEIDAVIIATPDHWHCKILADACEAGKDIYVEKPVANSIEECQMMEIIVNRTGRVVQVGQWQRSAPHFKEAIDFVLSGKLGNIRLVKTWAYQGWMKPIPVMADEPVPEGVNYRMWLGPAPQRPFNKNRFHFNFRWFWDYAGGLMTDWGVHLVDIALWGMKASAPRSVMASGGKLAYPDDASETPDTLQATYEYPGFNMLWEHSTGIDGGNYGRNHGIAFIGNNGTLVVDRGGWEVIAEGDKMETIPLRKKEGNDLDRHMVNFISCVRENKPDKLNCPLQVGSMAAINCLMGNVAYKTGKKIFWDQELSKFSDRKSNKLIRIKYHNGWKLPSV